MTDAPKILAFAGSTRSQSFNKRVIKAAALAAERAGAEVTLIDLKDYPLPLYDGDIEAEQGLPDNAVELKRLFLANRGLLIATPEYNGGHPAVLKNVIDWVSRSSPGEGSLAAYKDKVAGIMSASNGANGGLRSLLQLRQVLSNVGVLVLPGQRAVGGVAKLLDENGLMIDSPHRTAVEGIAVALVEMLRRLER